MVAILPDTTLVRIGELLSTELDDETVLMSIEAGRYYGMAGTARRIWALLAAPHTLADLSAQLSLEFQVTPAQCEQEILPFLEELVKEGMVRAGPRGDG